MTTDPKLLWAAWILVALATIALLYSARDFFVPLLVGIVFAYMLRPAVDLLVSARLPRMLAALVVVGAAGGLAGYGIYTLADDATRLLETLPKAMRTVRVALQDGRAGQPAAISKVREAANELDKAAAAASGQRAPAANAPATTPSFGARLQEYVVAKGISFFFLLGQALFALLLAWYVLSEGDTFKRKMIQVAGPSLSNRKVAVRILEDIDRQVMRHMLAVCVANALIGGVTAATFAALGVEQAVLWGVLAGLLHFIPYVGQAIITVGSTAAAYLQFGAIGPTVAVLASTLAISVLIGTVLMTWLQSRASRVNTTVLFVVMLFLGWLWGAWGLVLASPVIAIIKSICDHVPAFARAAAFLSGEKPVERAEPAPRRDRVGQRPRSYPSRLTVVAASGGHTGRTWRAVHFAPPRHLTNRHLRSPRMNWDRIEGNWKQLKGKAQEQWGKLTSDSLDKIEGKREQLAGRLQETYGIGKDEAEKQITDFEARCKRENWIQ